MDVDAPAGPRSYLVATPVDAVDRVLVINLHGHGGTAATTVANSGLVRPATDAGFVVVTPDGVGDPARWNFDRLVGQPDDYEFMRWLIDDLVARYCVDTGRVVLVGTSNGAAFAGLYGCLDERVVAVAMVIATTPESCDAGRRVPSMLTIRGDADLVVPYDNAQEWTATWAEAAGCSEVGIASEVWPGVERVTYPECADAQVIAIDTISGGVHAWPGATRPRPENSEAGTTYPAAARVIEFFLQTSNR